MKILTFTNLYPNASQPNHGVFVENRLRDLLSYAPFEARVVAPVPWFPFKSPRFGRYATFAAVPSAEERFGIGIQHPRYPLVPKIGMSSAPFLLYNAMRPVLARIRRAGYDFDLIDAHYLYPDGVAAALLGRHFRRPVTITAHGSDVHHIPNYRLPQRMIKWATEKAGAVVTVSRALKEHLVKLGVAGTKVRVLRNGINLELFAGNPDHAGSRPGQHGQVRLLSVGNLIPLKGHDLVIRSLAELPSAELTIVGHGPEEQRLKSLAQEMGLGERVKFVSGVPHQQMPALYQAADVLVLASEREGWPSVLLESMACGTPVVASNVWGMPEVVGAQAAGRLMPERTPAAVAATIAALLAAPPMRAETRAYAEGFSWRDTSRGIAELFQSLVCPKPLNVEH